MFNYYLTLAFRSFRRDIALTALMIGLIGLGVAASMTLVAQLRAVTADPIPTRSHDLYMPVLDPRSSQFARAGSAPPLQLTWTDAMNLYRLTPKTLRAVMTGGQVTVTPDEGRSHNFFSSARYTTSGIFRLFDIPMAAGIGWSQAEDDAKARVAVLSTRLAQQVFRSPQNAVGKTITLGNKAFGVVGVIAQWNPKPHFYDVEPGAYNDAEDIFIPLSTARDLKLPTMGNVTCWGDGLPTDLETAPCAWIQYWIYLPDKKDVGAYAQLLSDYAQTQKREGRFALATNTRNYSVGDLLDHEHIVPPEPKLQLLLAIGFLLVCMLNAAALILAKFIKRRPDLAVRRAMGATRSAIFLQLIIEASSVGLLGSLLALGLIPIGLFMLRQQPLAYASLIGFDAPLYASTIALAMAAATAAGIYPAWNACKCMPASFIKVQ